MSDSCVKYVQDELIRYKDSLQCIQDDIRSSEIELKTIEKNLNKLIKEKDWTEDILHSTSISSEESLMISTSSQVIFNCFNFFSGFLGL